MSYSYNAIKSFCERVGGVRKRFSNFHSISDGHQFYFRPMFFFFLLLLFYYCFVNVIKCSALTIVYFIMFGRLIYGDF